LKPDFRTRIKQGPILCDGAIGTLLDLYQYEELPHEIQNLKNPEIIKRIHREYIDAGAEIIQTNTFSANRIRLAQYHLEDKVAEINRAGVEIARTAAGDDIYVAGSVGPTGKILEPIGKLTHEEAREAFKEQIRVLDDAGVDVLILETFVSLDELGAAIDVAKELTKLPIIAQKTFPEDGSILAGTFPVEVVDYLVRKGVDVAGANCTVGPQRMFSLIRNMYKDGVILSAQPAAGIPTLLNGRALYHTSPEYLAQYANELLQAGVTLIGSCCGSTPAHTRAIRGVMDEFEGIKPQIRERERTLVKKPPVAPALSQQENEVDHRSDFAKNIGKKFLTTVELDVPRGLDMSSVIEGARYLHQYKIDAINITDGARARLRMSSLALCSMIRQHVGVETIMHLTSRDRNMLGVQAELLSAHALGLKNILCITGDPTKIGDYPQATSVFDVDSSGLIRAAASMNKGLDLAGHTIEQKTSFMIACAANPVADNMDAEIEKMERKVAAGAQVIFTQPLYEMKTLEQFLKRTEKFRIPVMLGLLPLRGHKHADFLHNEIPGMIIPKWIREKFANAGEKAGALGVEIAVNFLNEAKSSVAGVYMMPPFKKYEIIPEILEGANLLHEAQRRL
jgi:methionine synthase / methylenetetrahydrofolate reductase (NADH)